MKPSVCIFTAALLAVSVFAHADAGGTVYHHAAPTKLVSGYAYSVPDAFDPKKQAVVVVLSDTQIDAAAFDAAEDRKEAIDRFLLWQPDGKATTVTVMIGADKSAPVEQLGLAILAGEGLHSSASVGSGTYALDLTRNDGKRIEGSFRTRDVAEKSSPNGDYYDLHFALDVASGAPFGPGLPPDGGEPFKAYGDYSKALGDVVWHMGDDEMQQFVNMLSNARLAEINAAKGDKRKSLLKTMHERGIHSFRFVSGRVKGNVATLELSGKNADGAAATATVTMKREDKYWCFDGEKAHAPGA